jgi:clan AA aspartic protease
MITGSVNEALDAVVRVTIRDETGRHASVDAVVDTGFSAALMLPAHVIAELALESDGVREATMADGEIVVLESFRASVDWDIDEVNIEILGTIGEPLVGMELLQGFRLRIDVVPSGEVSIEALR